MSGNEPRGERATAIINVRLTPSQLEAVNALRRTKFITRTELIDSALAEYFTTRGYVWPTATRRAA